MKKKLLFIMQSYPSQRSANVLCDQRIMKLLKDSGKYDLHILCMQYANQDKEETLDGYKVHRIKVGSMWCYFHKVQDSVKIYDCIFLRIYRVLMRVKQALLIPLYPCYNPLVVFNMCAEVRRLHQVHSFDLVFCDHLGLETLLAGLSLKRIDSSVKIICAFWDSISGGFAPKYLPLQYVNTRRERLEEKVLEIADISIAMESHRNCLEDKVYVKENEEKGKLIFLNIPYLENMTSDVMDKGENPFERDRINMVFAGNLWGRRPEFLLEALAQIDDADLTLWLITGSDCGSLLTLTSSLHLEINFLPYMDHHELVSYLKNADILVNFGVENPSAISGKVIEYIGYCKPIVSTFSHDDEACIGCLSNYPFAFLFDERISSSSDQIDRLRDFIMEAKGRTLDFKVVSEDYVACMPATYCSLIEQQVEKTIN